MKTSFLFPALLLFLFSCSGSIEVYNPDFSGTEILTPPPALSPRINGPLVYGARPGHPFLYLIPCQGERPVEFSVEGLPSELSLDPANGIISGITPAKGEYDLLISAKNNNGTDKRKFKLISGDKLALTPPMGYNHWYAHYNRITDKMMREAADVMVSSGMADVGYQYVNIDDCWMNAPNYSDSSRLGPLRDASGNIVPNSNFPDMKGLADYIHHKGLKAGLYTSPGPLTCGGFSGSYGHELQDAEQFADWGYDFLKYDWCSYGEIANKESAITDSTGKKIITPDAYKKPYIFMGEILKGLDRDMVLNLCQYGMGDVWKWGAEVGGHCWRTAGDLGFELDRIFDVALKNSEHREYSRPGEWNDPDYIQIGWIGDARNMGNPKQILMPASLQYAYMSLWSLMAAPLVYSGDMSKLDEFTINVLCNPEVIDIDQDPLGISAKVIKRTDKQFIMIKELYDGSVAIGMFNRDEKPVEVTIGFDEAGITGTQMIRDLWRQKNIGKYNGSFKAAVPAEGVILVRTGK